MYNNKALVFDIIGQFAHFRTFYSNASSLTYGFPPRTALIGMIAAILGKERDSYYEILSPQNCKMSVSIKEPLKKIVQTINYIRTEKGDGFKTVNSAIEAHLSRKLITYPTSIEILMPVKYFLRYRIYFTSNDRTIYNNLKKSFENKSMQYPLYLGLSEFTADVEWIGEFEIKKTKDKIATSIISETLFSEIDFISNNKNISLSLEKMPFHFNFKDGFRRISSVKKFIYEDNCKKITLKTNDNICSVNGENIVWMET